MASFSKMLFWLLSLTLGFFFILVGILKLGPYIDETIFEEMKKEFHRFRDVFPFHKVTGWKPNANSYRVAIGSIEASCGVVLVLIPGPLKKIASLSLFSMMCGAVYTLAALSEPVEKMIPAIVCAVLLLLQLMLSMCRDSSCRTRATAEKKRQ